MKNLKIWKITKKIIYITIISLMLCNFIVPNMAYAADTNDGGNFYSPTLKFITYLCDCFLQWMQDTFTSKEDIDVGDGTYRFQYSLGIIFSGTVQGLDINFINPNTDVRNTNKYMTYFRKLADDNKDWEDATVVTEDEYNELIEDFEIQKKDKYILGDSILGDRIIGELKSRITIYYWEENNKLYTYSFAKFTGEDDTICYYKSNIENLSADFIDKMNSEITYTSIASQLQPTIATWYKALRRISLVGLLSVLVYVGIRIILVSSSPEGNSKYKKMLIDWLIALCLLFTLHYIMSFTIVVTQKISAVFNTGTEDTILATVRQKINSSSTWGKALTHVVIYVTLTIYTVIFTFKYLKRVLYMGFFTMIAPLITLTYPIDKIKDGKAQAFNMWMKEYIYNALIQVVHLVLYYALIGSAISLAESMPIYAIVAIGFISEGEKIIRKMFGFNNAETLGTVGAAATGGLIAATMSKIKNLPMGAKGGTNVGKGVEGKAKGSVRTASQNPQYNTHGGGTNLLTPNATNQAGSNAQLLQGANGQARMKKLINGTMALGGKYTLSAAKGLSKMAFAGTGALIGFASGIAEGDMGKATTRIITGGTAGKAIGEGVMNLPSSVTRGIKNAYKDVANTWDEGVNGEES